MASPTLDLVCCDNRSMLNSTKFDELQDVYQITAIVSSTFSIAGATFTLMPRTVSGIFRKRMIEGRQYSIIQLLALADLLACIGIICLESLLLCEANGSDLPDDGKTDHGFCLFFTAWIQYFYITTYFLTAGYAIDVLMMLKGSQRSTFTLPIVCFLCPLVLVSGGFVFLYEPNSSGLKLKCRTDEVAYLIPLYLASYIPMVTVMVMNPIIFYFSFNKVKPIVRGTRGRFTDRERTYLQAVQKKFFRIVAVFILCWWPNVFLGVINLYIGIHRNEVKPTASYDDPHLDPMHKVLVALWFFMGILNPLQAFLNTLVYVGWGGCCNIALFSCCRRKRAIQTRPFLDSDTDEIQEVSYKKTCGFGLVKSPRINECSPLIPNPL